MRTRTTDCNDNSEIIAPCTSGRSIQIGGQFSVGFTFTNNNFESVFVAPSTNGGCSSSPTSVTVPSHQARTFTITCGGSADGTGVIQVTADLVVAEISDTVSSVSITPDGTGVNALPNVMNRQIFTVQNLGKKKDTVDIATSCTTYSCSLQTATPLIIDSASSKPDTIQYTAGAIGSSGTVGITGTLRHPTTSKDGGYVLARVPSPLSPTISLAPHNGDNHLVGLCVASCFEVVAGYSTPSYTSRDAARSATLVYSSALAHTMGLVQVDVTDSSARHSQKFSLQLKQSNGSAVTFTTGTTELFFKQDTALSTRLAGQFDATSLATGVLLDTVIVKSIWTSGADSGTVTQSATAVPILITNEQASPFGAGWTLAGLQRLYFPSDTTMLVVTDGAGSITRFTRTCNACLATARAADFSTLLQTSSGGVVTGYRRTYRDGSTATFNPSGYLTSVQNLFSDSTKFAYDGSNHIQTITDPAGKTLTFAYTSGKLTTITDPGGRVSHFSVNGSGDLASITDPTSTVTFQGTYDASHRLTQTTDRAGGTWKYFYDAASKLASDSTPSVKVDTTIAGTGTLVTVRLGSVVRSLESTILPASGKGTSTNPADQRVSSSVRAVTFAITRDSTRYALDRFGGATQIETPTLQDTTFITRDSDGRMRTSLERMKGTVVQNASATYVGPRLTVTADALAGSSIAYTYDTTYDIVTSVLGSTQSVWNYLNTAKTLVDSSRVGVITNPVSRFTHDAKGRITLAADPQTDSTRAYYGSTGFQNTDSVYTGLNPTLFRYDASYGRLVRTVNARRDSTVTTLDLLNRVQSVQAQGGGTTSYAYDSLSRVRQITDAKGQVYAYHLNPLGWADTVTDAASSKNTADRRDVFEFTKTGAVRAHIDRNHWRTSHAFDRWGRDSVLTYTDARGSTRTSTFAYDSTGLWSAAANSESIDTVRTDSAGLTQIQTTWRGTTRYADTLHTDANGLPYSKVLVRGTSSASLVQKIAYGYDNGLLLNRMVVGGDSTRFFHNADGVLTAIKLMSPTGVKIDSIAYMISKVHQGVTMTHSAAALANFNASYARDSLGRITQRSFGDTLWNYVYDAHGHLTKYATIVAGDSLACVKDLHYMDGEHCTIVGTADTLRTQAFSYDSVGNRADNTPTLLAGNRLTSWLGYTLAYDSAGNLVRKSKSGFDQYLYWNSLGQLDSVKTMKSDTTLVSFGYDGFGRRVRKTVGTATPLRYIYDGAQIAVIDTAGTPMQIFTDYPGSETPHSVFDSVGKRRYFVTEIGAGSVWGLHDSTATVKNHYRYAPFGLLEDSSEVVKDPLRFASREYDPETRLYLNRARYYDPELARFISEDPIGQSGGVNQYAYVGNDPINATDPSGTCMVDFHFSSDMDGGLCSAGHGGFGGANSGASSLGDATDFVTSWGTWEAYAASEASSIYNARALKSVLQSGHDPNENSNSALVTVIFAKGSSLTNCPETESDFLPSDFSQKGSSVPFARVLDLSLKRVNALVGSSPGMPLVFLKGWYHGSMVFVEEGVIIEVANNMDGEINCSDGSGYVKGIYSP